MKLIGYLLMFLLTAATVIAETEDSLCLTADDQFAYGRDLLDRGDYETARVEFKRFLRFFPDDSRSAEARFRIGQAFFDGGDVLRALPVLSALIDEEGREPWGVEAAVLAARCHLRTGNPVLGEIVLRNLIEISTDPKVRDRARHEAAWLRLETGRWDRAREALVHLSAPGRELYQADLILSELEKTPAIPRKNPRVAGTLALIPGAGYLYCERYQDALIAFLLNGGLVLAAVESFDHDQHALGGVIAFVGFGFYAGNIYGSASSAHKYNRRAARDFLTRLKEGLSVTVLPDGAGGLQPALVVGGRF
jgi:tetratricopeptide (TPR) repeat protein